jgi:glycosyltransferase involved in cell wall biosynthesis
VRIWIITVGEPLPIDGENVRLYRSGLLSDELIKAGHEVVWWTSVFDHSSKKLRKCNSTIQLSGKSRIELLDTIIYENNISIKRIINHYLLGREFRKKILNEEPPDVILCSFPIIELCSVAVQYAKKNNIPIMTDVRDLWPDIFLNFCPNWTRVFLKIFLFKMFIDTKYVFQNSSSIIAVSDGYLDWGLEKANRTRLRDDMVFPIGYPVQLLNKHEKTKISKDMLSIGIDASKIIFLFIGSFGKTYDLTTVINAAKYYERGCDNLQFVFCGDGEKYDQWTNESKGISNIIFTGWLNGAELNYLLSISNVGLAAYIQGAPQGLPNKIFEYMSVGLPVLSSLQGETKELLSMERIGLTYNPAVKGDLINKIDNFLDKNACEAMIENSKQLFDSRFSAKTVYRDFRNEIERVVLSHNKEKT